MSIISTKDKARQEERRENWRVERSQEKGKWTLVRTKDRKLKNEGKDMVSNTNHYSYRIYENAFEVTSQLNHMIH
jgi:hypothetical protein